MQAWQVLRAKEESVARLGVPRAPLVYASCIAAILLLGEDHGQPIIYFQLSSAGAALPASGRRALARVLHGLRRVPWAGCPRSRFARRRPLGAPAPATRGRLGRRLEDAPLALVRVGEGHRRPIALELLRLEQADATNPRIIAMGRAAARSTGFQFDARAARARRGQDRARSDHAARDAPVRRAHAAALQTPRCSEALLSEARHAPSQCASSRARVFADLPCRGSRMMEWPPALDSVLDDELELEAPLHRRAVFETYRWHDVCTCARGSRELDRL
jgi:hypothetical protein